MLGGLEIDLRGYSVPVNYIYRVFPFLQYLVTVSISNLVNIFNIFTFLVTVTLLVTE